MKWVKAIFVLLVCAVVWSTLWAFIWKWLGVPQSNAVGLNTALGLLFGVWLGFKLIDKFKLV